MHPVVKLIIGAILMIASVWWVLHGSETLIGRKGLTDVVALLNAGIPIGAFFIGLFIVWLELDEIRIEREIRAEEKKAKKKKK